MENDQNGICVPPGVCNESVKMPTQKGMLTPGVDIPHFVTGTSIAAKPMTDEERATAHKHFITQGQANRPEVEKVEIVQVLVPSTGTKLVCTTCGTQDWHTLILRRKAGLIEGLCKQEDGSGCYPLASRSNCTYTYPNQVDCPQVAEYCVAIGKERRNPRQVCRDHVGEMLRQGPLYQIWPLED